MSPKILHLLTETDSFSDLHGAALQRWVANVLRFEKEPALVACSRADGSWALDHVQVLLLPGLLAYSKLRGRYRLPWMLRRPILRRILRPVVEKLGPGSVLWIHNRPDYATAIQDDVRRRGAKLVLHLHNSLLVSFPAQITRPLRADRLVFCSGYLEREAKCEFPGLENTSVIYNGADSNRFYPSKPRDEGTPKPPSVLFAGRLVPEKGAHIFVEAMRMLQVRRIGAQGRLLGATGFGSRNEPTPYSSRIMRNAPSNVHFGGYCTAGALADEFRAADIFCSPSVWEEPFGLVNVEAMASGLPTVSTRGGGVPEVFASGGAVLVARDSASELASALELVIRNSAFRRRLATEAYESYRRNFTWQVAHGRYRELIAGLQQA